MVSAFTMLVAGIVAAPAGKATRERPPARSQQPVVDPVDLEPAAPEVMALDVPQDGPPVETVASQ